jgi:hypothetical protein
MATTFLRRLVGGTVRPESRSKSRRKRCRLGVELLEARCLLSSDPFRSVTGFGNNVANSTWGQSGTDLLRVSPIAYADGISSPSTPNTLSPREISNNLNNQSNPIFSFADNLGPAQSQSLSDFAYVWGQFIDHDMDLTPTGSGQVFNIPADPTRPTDAMGTEAFIRSTFDPNTGTSTSNPRQQVNAITSYLDLSNVYGSTQVVADALRTFSGGLLKTSPGGLLPYDNTTYFTPDQIAALNMANDAQQVPTSSLFAAGDVRANENIELTAMQTLFVDNHNLIATELATMNPADFGFTSWTDENLYQEARKLNIAEEQMITYNEFLPAILGPNALPAYTGYNPNVNASIATEFSTVAFRFGHSLLSNGVGRLNNDGTSISDVSSSGSTVNLTEDFFRPDLINPAGVTVNLVDRNGNPDPHTTSNIGAILKADASNAANEMDLQAIDEVRSLLFGIPNAPGTDLIARDIQRARDDGIGTYNQVRVAYGLPAVTSFDQISSDPNVQAELRATYGTNPDGTDNVNAVDPLEGMFAEDHVSGGDVGITIKTILVDQFTRLRDGDRFFYLNESFTPAELSLLGQGNTLAKVIEDNTSITNLQKNVFFFKESITGKVFVSTGGGHASDGKGVAGVTVQLLDTSGNVLTTTTTDSKGRYSFTDQTGIPGTGQFNVAIVAPAGFTQSTPNPATIALTRGSLEFDGVDFGLVATGGSQGGASITSSTSATSGSTGVAVASSNDSNVDIVRGLLESDETTSSVPAGSNSSEQDQSASPESPEAVANVQLAVLRNSGDSSVTPVGADTGASAAYGGEPDSFWSSLAAAFQDAIQ